MHANATNNFLHSRHERHSYIIRIICIVAVEEFAKQFGIDGKLLLSQAVNFFLLLVILRAFAYKPIFAILQKRKERIEEGLSMADEAEKKLATSERIVSGKIAEAERKAGDVLGNAEKAAKQRETLVLEEAERKKERLMNEAKMQLLGEEEKMRKEFAREAKTLIRLALGKAVGQDPDKVDEALVGRAVKEMESA